MSFDSVRLRVCRVLRDNKQLRGVEHREQVWRMVCKDGHESAKFSTVDRMIRKLQNEEGLYLVEKEDNRYVIEEEYIDYFGGKNE